MPVRITFGVLALSLLAEGCGGSGDCTETATCAAPMDGSTGSDAIGVDVVATDGPAADSSSGSDAGHMDSGSNDAMTIPDVVFIDSSTCPTGSQCVDAVPAGWDGPVVLFDETSGPPAPTAPACPSSYPADVYDGNATPSAPSAVCGCSCGSVTGADCNSTTPLTVQLFSDSLCVTQCASDAIPYTTLGFCVASGCTGALSAKVGGATAENGSCAVTTTSNTVPAWGWTETARACQVTSVGGGCSSGQVCAPSPPGTFGGKVCVFQSGDVSCPGVGYTQKHTYYGSATDSRACTTCSCASPTGITCSGGAVAVAPSVSGSACAGPMDPIPTNGTCTSVNLGPTNDFVWATAEQTASGGTCAVQGGAATGSVTPAGPTTVCCQP